jgi:signal transduction histidine kinase
VHVRRGPEAVTIEVSDNGVSTNGVASTPGNGLRGMRERAAAVGGSVDAGHRDGGGWQVRANLPLTGSVGNASAADGASS